MIVDPRRSRPWNHRPARTGPVVYWMSRDQRVANNWALLRAQELALEKKSPLGVVFTLAPDFLGAPLRAYDFMCRGLAALEQRLLAARIPFFLLAGPPAEILFRFCQRHRVGAVVMDFDPLRPKTEWKKALAQRLPVHLEEVDAHNIVPAWVASPKLEYAAFTFRPKIHKLLDDFLTPFPALTPHPHGWPGKIPCVDWAWALDTVKPNPKVGPVSRFTPGEAAGARRLGLFLKERLGDYAESRNDPTRDGQSNLSPYLHFGQISPQRVALEAFRQGADTPSGSTFLEELIVRRELSDNYCLYNSRYDSVEGFPDWSRSTLHDHRGDKRPFTYSLEAFEHARTHDALWNAAQRHMVDSGKMHGYLRMYWAKKILEWSDSPEEAMHIALTLNDRYEVDGRDPNGYAGVAWSIGGVHDRPWFRRPVFGSVRWMSRGGCASKFDVEGFIRSVP